MDCNCCFSRFVCIGPFWHLFPVSGDRNVLLFLVQGEHFSQEKFNDLLLGRKGELTETFRYLLFLKCLEPGYDLGTSLGQG